LQKVAILTNNNGYSPEKKDLLSGGLALCLRLSYVKKS